MKEIRIKDKVISEDSQIFFIAEIGINHNGILDNAKKLIDIANIYGADAVKFQKRTPELCVPKKYHKRIIETPWGDLSYLEYRKKLEFGEKEYKEIDKYCKSKDLIWFASVWDLPSVDFLEEFNIPCYKIASAKLTDKELLEKVRDLKKPIFLSLGMSTEEQIAKAIYILKESDLILLHCNSSYPAPDEDLNLKYIKTLKKKYPQYIVGYSGHEYGISASLIAAELGAKVIERHVTLDRAMWGSDQAASLEISGIRRLIRDLRRIKIWKGNGIKKVTETEKKIRDKLRNKNTL